MGFFNRMRKAEAENGGALNVDLASGGVKPPWCPFLAGHVQQQAGSIIELAGGAKGVSVQVSVVPLPCWRRNCMMWDRDNPDGERCGLLSLMDAVLYADEDDEEGGEGVPSA